MKDEEKIIDGHEYDGIKELDNPLPKWWLNLFYATIVFAVGYYGYYEIGNGPSHSKQLETSMIQITNKRKKLEEETASKETILNLKEILADKETQKLAIQQYQAVCSACHSIDGGGLIGPNLTDSYWIHSKGELAMVLKAIREGYPEKGMPPWKDIVPKELHVPLAAYVVSLQGTQPASPKEPQGELVE